MLLRPKGAFREILSALYFKILTANDTEGRVFCGLFTDFMGGFSTRFYRLV